METNLFDEEQEFVFFDEFEAFGVGVGFGDGDNEMHLAFDDELNLYNEESREDGSSSGTGTTTTTKEDKRRDRKKTLITERKRRSKMKDMLYELRSLVPNITKMDKASIVSDAVMYVKSLKEEKEKLTKEISRLQSPTIENRCLRVPTEGPEAVGTTEGMRLMRGRLVELMAFEIGSGKFNVRMECNKGDKLPPALYATIESLEFFYLESSLFMATPNGCVITFTLNVRDCMQEMDVETLKLWVMGALLIEGFELETKYVN